MPDRLGAVNRDRSERQPVSEQFNGDVIIDEPARRSIERHPSDLLRLVVALGVTAIGFLLATVFNNVAEAITVEVIEIADSVPTTPLVVVILAFLMFAFFLPFFAVGFLVFMRRWRRLFLGLLASVLAMGLVWLVEAQLVSRFGAPSLIADPPSWVCTDGTESGISCIPGSGVGHIYYMAGGVAYFSSLVPWMTQRWRRFGWIAIVTLMVVRMIQAVTPPLDELLVVGLAYAIGAAVLLIFGMPDRRPRGAAAVKALQRSGLDVSELSRAAVDARGSTPYFAKLRDGSRLFVKVLTPEERAADTMFRVIRMFRLKGVGDERPFSSLKRAVEHEAVGSLKAASDGVKTPRLEAIAEIEPSSMLMAYTMIDGSSLDGVPPEALTDEVLEGVWRLVAKLRERRTAHRDLRLANVFLDDEGEPWLIDFGFAELAATDGQLRSDVAELITSTAVVVGAERAVANAVAGIGKDAVADAASRIQPLALSGATRDALKHQKGLDEEIRTAIAEQTGVESVELEDLERVKGRVVLMVVGFALAVYFLIPQLTQTDFGAVLKADWRWAPAILLASFVTYVGAAFNIMGSIPDRLRLFPTVLSQFAGTFINRITPVKVGGMATNVRFMQKNGVDLSVAVAGIGVSSVGTAIIHIGMLLMFIPLIGKNPGDFIELPSGTVIMIGAISVILLIGAVLFLPMGRKIVKEKVWPTIKKSGDGLRQVATSPLNAMMLFGGAFAMIIGYIVALWFSLEAFGGGLSFFAVGAVFLAAQALGQAAPTPGGIGAVEAAMIAAMTTLGLDASVAVPTVFLYRIATFWLPILPGVFALRKLEADGAL
jgi:undecaprenyl-diphosphatase